MYNKSNRFRVWNATKGIMYPPEDRGNYALRQDGSLVFQVAGDTYLPIDVCIISWYTGFSDNTGVDIYEGDIIQYDGLGIGTVCFDFGAYFVDFLDDMAYYFFEMDMAKVHVCGNRYEDK